MVQKCIARSKCGITLWKFKQLELDFTNHKKNVWTRDKTEYYQWVDLTFFATRKFRGLLCVSEFIIPNNPENADFFKSPKTTFAKCVFVVCKYLDFQKTRICTFCWFCSIPANMTVYYAGRLNSRVVLVQFLLARVGE